MCSQAEYIKERTISVKKLLQLLLVTLSLAMFALLSPVAAETTSAHATKMQTPSFANTAVTLQSRSSESSLAASRVPADVYGCPSGDLCLYSNANFNTGDFSNGGQHLYLYNCASVDLGSINFPGGGKWNDKVSSWINNQTSGTWSFFYNLDNAGNRLYVDGAPAYTAKSWVGWYNDSIDIVHVC